jgi:glutaredoxin
MLLSFLFCERAIADFYKWEDEKGATQITDYPPPQDKTAKNVQIHSKDQSEDLTNSQNEPPKEPDVILYTKNDCPDCDKTREFLKSKNIIFTEYNTDTDKNAAIKRKEIDDNEDVPFAIIYKNRVYGFSESVYERLLKKK